jgi:hypothetical protein
MLDQFADQIAAIGQDERLAALADHVRDWKKDDSTVEELRTLALRYIGHVWLEQKDHDRLWSVWQIFVPEIDSIRGMTMNERLFTFGLFERWDGATDDIERHCIYRKLLASY